MVSKATRGIQEIVLKFRRSLLSHDYFMEYPLSTVYQYFSEMVISPIDTVFSIYYMLFIWLLPDFVLYFTRKIDIPSWKTLRFTYLYKVRREQPIFLNDSHKYDLKIDLSKSGEKLINQAFAYLLEFDLVLL